MHDHLNPHQVASARTLADDDRLELTRTCPRCREAAYALDRWILLADHPDVLVAPEIEFAHSSLDELKKLPLERALRSVEIHEDHQTWGLTRLTLLSANRILKQGPPPEKTREVYELSRIALDLALRLDPSFYGAQPCLRLLDEAIHTLRDALEAYQHHSEELHEVFDRVFHRALSLMVNAQILPSLPP